MKFETKSTFVTKLKDGLVSFKIADAAEDVNANGKELMKFKLFCTMSADKEQDTLLHRIFGAYKKGWEDFFRGIGKEEWFERGECEPEQFLGLTGYAYIKINEKGYPEVQTFLTKEAARQLHGAAQNTQKASVAPSETFEDSDLPF